MAGCDHFTKRTFSFLKDLAAHNRRDWFQDNKARYEEDVRQPALRLVADMVGPLEKISTHLVADPRPNGGSLFRIHRDTRFSKDKSPYKTVTGVQFRHEEGKDAHCPGLYVHVEPGRCFVASGIWHPDSKTLAPIRHAIADDAAGWKKASRGKRFADVFGLEGDALKRAPRDFDPDHPLIDDLRRRDFIGVAHLKQAGLCSATLPKDLAALFGRTKPFLAFLCDALGVPF